MNRRSFLAGATALAPALATPLESRAQARRFLAAEAYSAERGGVAFLVMRNGVVLSENYLAPGGAEIAYPLGGATKTLAAVLAAAMAQDRMLTLDEPAALTIGDWGLDPAKARITVRQLLNLTSGLAAGRRGAEPPTAAEAIAAPVTAEPGQAFVYDDAPYTVFAELAARKLVADGREPDVSRYLQRRVFDPLGVSAEWTRAGDGALWLGSGAAMTARDLARVGELVRRDGIWRARRTLGQATLEESFRGSFAGPRFGVGWWLADALPPTDAFVTQVSDVWTPDAGIPRDAVMGVGAAGQRICLIPSRSLVVVRLTEGRTAAPASVWSDAVFLRLLLSEA